MSTNPPTSKKRKGGPPSSGSSAKPNAPRHAQKRVKLHDVRQIRASPPTAALNADKELDVGHFVRSHEAEIRSLERSMEVAKAGLATRAFQSVPRELRRRTASHNVKKVPKRLRNRAAREMREDNTPTVERRKRDMGRRGWLKEGASKTGKKGGKGATVDGDSEEIKAKPDAPQSSEVLQGGQEAEKKKSLAKAGELATAKITVPKFRKRQIHKAWLPTHIWHTKRAHMTDPKAPLWRFAIPLAPTEKSYRITHRASSIRGCVAWDTSYMSCIGINGETKSLLNLLKALGVPETNLTGKQGERWRKGNRSWSGWLRERDGEKLLIAKVVIVWEAQTKGIDKRKLLIRLHPSAFYQLWNEACKVAKMQRPVVKVEDLRFEIGSIEITGPAATESLVGVLALADAAQETRSSWSILAGINDLKSLPASVIIQTPIIDPRLRAPLQTTSLPTSANDQEKLLATLTEWPFDGNQTTASLLDGKSRSDACRILPSQKSINRRKGEAAPGEQILPLPSDPRIPTILMTTNASSVQSTTGSWTILLPWKCVLPVWYCLMHYPVSSGNNPRLGGLEQQRQLCFECGTPWFPGDFPGTKAGYEWELKQREERKHNWEKRPKGKRVEWDSLSLGTGKKGEIGNGWACDWERLLTPSILQSSEQQSTITTTSDKPSIPGDVNKETAQVFPDILQYSGTTTFTLQQDFPPTMLAAISITLSDRGHAAVCARIYRLPTTDSALRESWLSLSDSHTRKSVAKMKTPLQSVPWNGLVHERRSALAAALLADSTPDQLDELDGHSKPTAGDDAYPHSPGEEDLVGFVTTGNYNLGEGKATAIGNVLLVRLTEELDGEGRKGGHVGGLCIVREAGQGVGRLARWTVV